ncbi:MAG: class III poly(R)-hydroxyalkanoic acid synthase subunit PhaE [Gammaproteobacteria bacterium]|nr:MAG: class III poly(R)-hydroxyalkanoic acid synthase subunit PhaE [Gammaproteobacteria bacterium]
MPEDPSKWFEQGSQAWLTAQQEYWKMWAEMTGTTTPPAPTEGGLAGFGAWSEALEQWQNLFLGKPNDPVKDMFQRTSEIGKQYMNMAERFYHSSSEHPKAEDMIDGWLGSLEDSFKHWKKQLESGLEVDMPDVYGLGKTTVKAWQHMAEKMLSAAQVPEISLNQIPGYAMARDHFVKSLGAPAMGLSRERQEQLQRLAERLLEYGEALRAYKLAFAKNGLRSIEALSVRFNKMSHDDEEIKSLRALYDLWVEVNEEIYDKFAMSDEYQVVYGDMVNSLMAVRKEMNTLAEDSYRAMNLPTRSDLDAVAQRAQQARRENRALKRELERLSKRMEELQQASSAKASPSRQQKRKTVTRDDLTQIKGIGPKMQQRLYEQGITAFEQLATLNKKAISNLEQTMNIAGKATREEWVKQAKGLLKNN